MSLFLRLLGEEDKGAALEAAVRSVAAGEADARVFEVDPESFGQVPGAPFAYWVDPRVLELFLSMASQDFETKCGMGTLDDFRFLRLRWERNYYYPLNFWISYAKGGEYSAFYSDIYLLVNWRGDGTEVKTFVADKVGSASRKIQATSFYFRPGLTWPRRTNGLSFRVMPAGCIFADKGPAAFTEGDDPETLLSLCAVINSAPFFLLISLQLARTELAQSFEVGLIQQTPVPELSRTDTQQLADLARRAWSLKRSLDTTTLNSHALILPALLQVAGTNLGARAAAWAGRAAKTERALAVIQAEIDDRCFDLYGFTAADRAAALGTDAVTDATTIQPDADDATDTDDPAEDDSASSASLRCNNPQTMAAELFDWLVGVAFGRFDLRLATGEHEPPPEPEPFDPLPVCSPGMLTGADGLPAAAPPPGYPLDFPADGILVDDAGSDGQTPTEYDLIRRIQAALRILTAETQSAQREHQDPSSPRPLRLCGDNSSARLRGDSLEAELCALLGVKSLRDWLRRPAGFFADHLGRWSKSRRKAPLCWPLSTESGGYTLWLYYPRLTDQTLFICVNDHLDPKVRAIEGDLDRLRAKGEIDAKARRRIDDLVALQREVLAMREELLRVANLPYKPDQNDGVLITAAPLGALFRHKPWQKELKRCWESLVAGDYDWAHLAFSLYPTRVRERCRTDRSLAIAHGLEDLYQS